MKSPSELAERTGLTAQYINKLIRQGVIKAERIGKKGWAISEEEAERFIQCRQEQEQQRSS